MYGRGSGGRGPHGHEQGYKRRREDVAHKSSSLLLLESLINFGDDSFPELSVSGESVRDIAERVKRELQVDPDGTISTILDCAVHLPAKAPLYALIVGLLNVEEPDVAKRLIDRITGKLDHLTSARADPQARLLLRFAASLAACKVVEGDGLVEIAVSLVKGILALRSSDELADRIWTLRNDHLVYAVVTALPYAGENLLLDSKSGLQELRDLLSAYLDTRKDFSLTALRPFAASVKGNDVLAKSDFGASSFAPEFIQAFSEYIDGDQHDLPCIPRPQAGFKAELANSIPHKISVELRVERLDDEIASLTREEVGSYVLENFPPRGILPFLDRQHTEGDRPVLDRILSEDYILDTIRGFESSRVECAKRLSQGLPIPHAYEPLLCQVLFSQMLLLPKPLYKPILYGTLMVELCKLKKLFPRAMSACVRECFSRMNVLDPDLRIRQAEWLAYHLSNFEFVWPWQKWQHVLTAPPYDGQRRFCTQIMDKLVRLSYWDRVQSVIPDEFKVLLPPKPVVNDSSRVLKDTNEDQEASWTAELVDMIRGKSAPEIVEEWTRTRGLADEDAGSLVLKAVLVSGAKSYTHMVILLERYYGPLQIYAQNAGLKGEYALIETSVTVWKNSSQRASMALDRLLTLRLVSVISAIDWVFESGNIWNIDNEEEASLAWEIFQIALDKSIARVQDAEDDFQLSRAHTGNDDAGLVSLSEKEAYLVEAKQQEQAALERVLRHIALTLPSEWTSIEELLGVSEEAVDRERALTGFKELCLISFTRRYHKQIATHWGKLKDELPESIRTNIYPYFVF